MSASNPSRNLFYLSKFVGRSKCFRKQRCTRATKHRQRSAYRQTLPRTAIGRSRLSLIDGLASESFFSRVRRSINLASDVFVPILINQAPANRMSPPHLRPICKARRLSWRPPIRSTKTTTCRFEPIDATAPLANPGSTSQFLPLIGNEA